MCSYAFCKFPKNKSWPLEEAKSRQQTKNEHCPPRDRGNLKISKRFDVFRHILFYITNTGSATFAPQDTQHINCSSVGGVVERTTAKTYCSYCCSIDWLWGSRCCCCRCCCGHIRRRVFFLLFFWYVIIVCRQRCSAQDNTQQSAWCYNRQNQR